MIKRIEIINTPSLEITRVLGPGNKPMYEKTIKNGLETVCQWFGYFKDKTVVRSTYQENPNANILCRTVYTDNNTKNVCTIYSLEGEARVEIDLNNGMKLLYSLYDNFTSLKTEIADEFDNVLFYSYSTGKWGVYTRDSLGDVIDYEDSDDEYF